MKKSRFLIIFFTFVSLNAVAQENLSTLLKKLSQKHKVFFSFSSTLTDNVYPESYIKEGTLDDVLKSYLKDTDFTYRVYNKSFYRLIINPVEIIEEPEPVVIEIERDTFLIASNKIEEYTISNLSVKENNYTDNVVPVYYEYTIPQEDEIISQPFFKGNSIKTNLLYDALLAFSVGTDAAITKNLSLDISGSFSYVNYTSLKMNKHFLIQPELRWWFKEYFKSHFVGVHLHYGYCNYGGKLPWGFRTVNILGDRKDFIINQRYQGHVIGTGISYGYQYSITNRLHLETVIGLGFAKLIYNTYDAKTDGRFLHSNRKTYWGPTKIAFNLVYILK